MLFSLKSLRTFTAALVLSAVVLPLLVAPVEQARAAGETVTLTSDVNPSVYGDAVTFTATMDPAITGMVDFLNGAESMGTGAIVAGTATKTISNLTVGGHGITAILYTTNPADPENGTGSNTVTQTVSKAPLTITAAAKSRVYGESNPTLTTTLSGFKLSETWATSGITGTSAIVTTVTSTGTVAGSPYVITPSVGTLSSGNYSFSFATGALTITKAPLTITAAAKSRVYGESNPTLTTTLSGFKLSETWATSGITGTSAIVTTVTSTGTVAGSPYTITPSVGTLSSGNYSFSFATGALTITKAPLTVVADDYARLQNTDNPRFTGTITGIQNSDDLTATYATTATSTSPVGTYAIVPTVVDPDSKEANYTVTLTNGTLTVNSSSTSNNARGGGRGSGGGGGGGGSVTTSPASQPALVPVVSPSSLVRLQKVIVCRVQRRAVAGNGLSRVVRRIAKRFGMTEATLRGALEDTSLCR